MSNSRKLSNDEHDALDDQIKRGIVGEVIAILSANQCLGDSPRYHNEKYTMRRVFAQLTACIAKGDSALALLNEAILNEGHDYTNGELDAPTDGATPR